MKLLAQATNKFEYTPLSPLPNTVDSAGKSNLETYVPGIFTILIGLAAVLAVGRIIWGGIMYITTDAWNTKTDGKEMIKNAVLGLVLVIASWVIFSTINPGLFSTGKLVIDLSIGSDTITGGLPTIGSGVNPCADSNAPGCTSELAAEQVLSNATPKIALNSPCTATSCVTQVGGFTQTTKTGILSLNSTCNCSLVITGGSEQAGHSVNSDHYKGTGVDLQSNGATNTGLNKTITGSTANPTACFTKTVNLGGSQGTALYEPKGSTCGGSQPSTGDHWHISF